MKKSDQKLVLLYIFSDIIMLNLSLIITLIIKYGLTFFNAKYSTYIILSNVLWLIVININDAYNINIRNSLIRRFYNHAKIFVIYTLLISFFLVLVKSAYISRFVIFGSISFFFILKWFSNFVITLIMGFIRKKGKNLRRVLVIGAGRIGQQFSGFCNRNPELGYSITGYLDDNHIEDTRLNNILGKIEDIDKVLRVKGVDEVIIALPLIKEEKIKYVIKAAEYFGKRVRLLPDFNHLIGRAFTIRKIGEMPIINIREIPLDDLINYYFKRFFDISFSFIILLLLAPLFLIIALSVKFESKGPIFYRPLRVGREGRQFFLLKFRTMYNNDDHVNGTKSTVPDDPRITKVGKFLRKWNLDELPQFFNVFKGDMSVVGPRPHRVWLNEQMRNGINDYMVRHYLRPGITGWAQVNGWRGLLDNEEKMQQRTLHDIWYLENWSFLLDIKIIFLTLFSKKTRINSY